MASELKNLSIYSENGILTQNQGKKYIIGIAVSEWNQEITANLAEAAIDTLKKYGFKSDDIILKSVPGSFELVQAAKFFIDYANVDAVICLGCVIQGETRHFDFVCSGVTQGIMALNTSNYNVPISFGLLTTNNLEQAKARSGGKYGNKGDEAAIAVLKMLNLKKDLSENK
jgi:6,7-dimethyl-8-ribityllumazine synthase